MYFGERFNGITHLLGALFSIAGLVTLVILASEQGSIIKVVAFSIYGGTLVNLYAISTLYHSIRPHPAKAILQKFDHCAIYLLIAGSYTPFALITLHGPWGWTLFGLSWGLAAFGIGQELTLGRRTRALSMGLYVIMGWLIVIAIGPLLRAMPVPGILWLAAGGITYSVGIYFFVNDERRHYHGIWHLFVLGGSVCQYICVLRYLV
jgi:hemolysin III